MSDEYFYRIQGISDNYRLVEALELINHQIDGNVFDSIYQGKVETLFLKTSKSLDERAFEEKGFVFADIPCAELL